MSLFTVETRGAVALITFSRPASLNALGLPGDGAEAKAVCERINGDRSLRSAVLTGSGRAFSAGGDIKAMRAKSGMFAGSEAEIAQAYRLNVHRMVRAFHRLEIPLIAAVNGPAVGLGCDIACLADIRLASEQASFATPFIKIGLVPGDGGAWLLPRLIGQSRAAELLFTGRALDADEALACGLVSRVVAAERLLPEALALAEDIAAQPGEALRRTKALLRQGESASFEAVMAASAEAQAQLHLSPDHVEGLDAILEKRPPRFNRG